MTSVSMAAFFDELEKIAGRLPKGLRAIAHQRFGAGEYAARRQAAHKFGRTATRPRKYEYVATGRQVEARTPKSPNPSPAGIASDIREGGRWRKMAREELERLSSSKIRS